MKSDFTITLDSELKAALEAAAIAEGQSAENLMQLAIKTKCISSQASPILKIDGIALPKQDPIQTFGRSKSSNR